MNQANQSTRLRVLIAPLDWGLGHATRCIPIIRTFLNGNWQVTLAASGKTADLLKQEFPEIALIHLEGYGIRYSGRSWSLPFTIASQIPRVLKLIRQEHQWLKELTRNAHFDLIISDNRYGLYHRNIPCIFITHQLRIKTPLPFLEDRLQKLNYSYIDQFKECWVPDYENGPSLAGDLSHPELTPDATIRYIGPLSRFHRQQTFSNETSKLLILLSGPEPQRTILERTIIEQLTKYKGSADLVRGLPGSHPLPFVGPYIRIENHLSSQQLQQKIDNASFVIARCGYSTIMDIAALCKKSILIPTPGQTEQEYLADHLMSINFALCIKQKKFNLKAALDLATNFPYRPLSSGDHENLDEVIARWERRLSG